MGVDITLGKRNPNASSFSVLFPPVNRISQKRAYNSQDNNHPKRYLPTRPQMFLTFRHNAGRG